MIKNSNLYMTKKVKLQLVNFFNSLAKCITFAKK